MLDLRQEIKELIENCYCEILKMVLPELRENWKVELHIFVNNNYKKNKANYEALYKYYQSNEPSTVDLFSLDSTALSALLLYFEPITQVLTRDSMPKHLRYYIAILRDGRNSVVHQKVHVDEGQQRDFYYDQFNALSCIAAFSSLLLKSYPENEKWGILLQKALFYQKQFLGERWNYIACETKAILNPSEDFSVLLLNAENGDITSQIKVAKAYYYGDRVEKDEGKAYYWFYKAGTIGKCPEAWYYIGKCYYSIGSVDTDFEKGKSYIQKAADAGVPEALNEIATLLFATPGKTREEEEYLFSITSKAAEKEYAPAVRHLSLLYRCGIGVKKNEELAESLLIKAAKLGEIQACRDLAKHAKEKGNIAGEIEWLSEALKNGDDSAIFRINKIKRKIEKKEENALR